MNSVGDAHAAALLMMQQHHQQQQGMSSFAGETGSANAAKPRQPGLPPTPPPPQQQAAPFGSGQQRGAAPGNNSNDACMEVDDPARRQGLPPPPRKANAHRRSHSDVPFGYSFAPPAASGGGGQQPLAPPKLEAGGGGGWGGGGEADDLFTSYLNLEGINSSDDSRGSSIKTSNGADSVSDTDEPAADSGIHRFWADAGGHQGLKRSAAAAGDSASGAAPALGRHARSMSMDSFIGKLSFAAAGGVPAGPNRFSLDFGGGEFTPAEMKKIMADEKLAEMAIADPRRVKRVLANRQSAARSKERKMRYIAELEHKVQILQTEATTLSAQLTLLQRDSAGIATQNNELKFRLQAMEQQAQLRDALNEALTGEVQRLKIATAELGDSCSSNNLAQQMQLQDQMFQLQQQQQQQATPIPFYQLQHAQQNGVVKNHESKE